jgi:hypothetical protein
MDNLTDAMAAATWRRNKRRADHCTTGVAADHARSQPKRMRLPKPADTGHLTVAPETTAALGTTRTSRRGMHPNSMKNLQARHEGGCQSSAADDEDWGDSMPADFIDYIPPAKPKKGKRARLEKTNSAWVSGRSCMRSRVMRATPAVRCRQLQERQRELQGLQECVRESSKLGLGHGLLQLPQTSEALGHEQPAFQRFRPGGCPCRNPVVELWGKHERDITVFSHRSRHCIKLPQWRCMTCKQCFEPAAEDFGYWPSTPTMPDVWFDMEVVEDYHDQSKSEGLSATGERVYLAPSTCLAHSLDLLR